MIRLTLTNKQRTELETYMANPLDDIPAYRLKIIALSDQGYEVNQIAAAAPLHPENVRRWLHRYEELGIDGLRNRGRGPGCSPGRPLVFEAPLRAQMAKLYATPPLELGLPFTRWTLERMKKYLIDRGLVTSISIQTVRRCVTVHRVSDR